MLVLSKPLTATQEKAAVQADLDVRAVAPRVRPAQLALWDERPRLVRDRDQPWVLLPFEADPLRTAAGGYPLPADAARDLAEIRSTGVDFDRLAVAHEIVSDRVPPKLMASAGPTGVAVTMKEAASMIGAAPAPIALRRRAQRADKLIRSCLGLVATVAAAPLDLLAVDPIIFGVVGLGEPPSAGAPALFYPLAAWEW